jgi:hypothetical protein
MRAMSSPGSRPRASREDTALPRNQNPQAEKHSVQLRILFILEVSTRDGLVNQVGN